MSDSCGIILAMLIISETGIWWFLELRGGAHTGRTKS